MRVSVFFRAGRGDTGAERDSAGHPTARTDEGERMSERVERIVALYDAIARLRGE